MTSSSHTVPKSAGLTVILVSAVVAAVGFAGTAVGIRDVAKTTDEMYVSEDHHNPRDDFEAAKIPLSETEARGKALYSTTCITCHGPTGLGAAAGPPYVGANLQVSRFLGTTPDAALLAFIRKGRLPGEPGSVLNGTMPPRGLLPETVPDSGIMEIIAYLKTFQR